MYWPTGSPNAYALSRELSQKAVVIESHDGAQSGASTAVAQHHTAVTNSDPSSNTNLQIQQASIDSSTNDTPPSRTGNVLERDEIVSAKTSRSGGIFVTITRSSATIWQSKPAVALASVVRSPQSMNAYGPSVALVIRPDASIITVQTSLGYLITYSLAIDPHARVYAPQLPNSVRHSRKGIGDGTSSYRKAAIAVYDARPGERDGFKEVNVRFRMVIRIDAGISKAVALDDELMIATQKPAALQCIQWTATNNRAQTSTELTSKLPWMTTKSGIIEMVHDRPMNLNCWITSDGKAYAVQRRGSNQVDADNSQSLFQGVCFREPAVEHTAGVKAAINSRFSLIAIGLLDGSIDVFIVKDYAGNIPLSHQHKLSVSSATSGQLMFISYSPDGYCLFAGYEKGWATWSVYGKSEANTFTAYHALTHRTNEPWLDSAKEGFWIGGGCEFALLSSVDDRLWILDMTRTALTGCFSPANISRGLLHSSHDFMLYRGHEVSNLAALSTETNLWQTVQIPTSYLLHNWPIRSAVVSQDGKYVAVAGRRGLAHFSVASSRWRTFEDPAAEHEFAVRGGMCWHHHFLIAAVEVGSRYQVRLYSREKALDHSHILHKEELAAPAIYTTVSGADSLLVYTYDNILLHYVIAADGHSAKLVQVGQIGFHGIIRAPPRVRAISWILPEDQIEHGDPAQDVTTAAVLFLVDGKLVLLQPSVSENGELKYDMRVIAQNVEYYMLHRECQSALLSGGDAGQSPEIAFANHLGHSLRDSLWFFDGNSFHFWSDIQDVLACAPSELGRDLPSTVRVPVDFYPVSALVSKGIIHGLEADLSQRRDVNFSFFRQTSRAQLFLPQLLRYHLAEYNSPTAIYLSQSYQHLPYFAHALEVLLHNILDNEVDNPPSPPETALLPTALSFMSSFSSYLDIIVNCTRKTELRSWRTLFSYLPPVSQLFEQSLAQEKLKTAAGYLLVLHTFEQESFQVHESAHLLKRAVAAQDWELSKELARFLVGIDNTGQTLQSALAEAGLTDIPLNGSLDGRLINGSVEEERASIAHQQSNGPLNGHRSITFDYFSIRSPTRGTVEEDFTTPDS